MALNMKMMQKWFLFGGVAGIASIWLLGFISNLVSQIPGVSLDLQSITVGTSGLGGIIDPTLGQRLLGFLPLGGIGGTEILGAFVGGGLFVLLGAWLMDTFKMLQFAKSKTGKLATVFVIAGLVSGWIVAASIGIPPLGAIIAMVVNAWILSFILLAVAKTVWPKLIPV